MQKALLMGDGELSQLLYIFQLLGTPNEETCGSVCLPRWLLHS
jgi:hypothetical protein